jgi:thioredoxin reductase (NADPH)
MPADVSEDPTDPYLRQSQTFPILTAEMTSRARRFGVEAAFETETPLFERGDRDVDFFVVLEGSIAIVAEDARTGPATLVTHGPGQFTGEMNLYNDRQILVGGRASAGSRVIRVRRPDFRRLVSAEPDIGEIVMRAYILRRVAFIRHAQGGVTLVGAQRDGDLTRIRRFLTRNGYPHDVLDGAGIEGTALLEGLDLAPDDLPAVIAPGRKVFVNPSDAELAEGLGLTEPLDPSTTYDVAVVGAGPAGLAAAVYAASEGLETVVIEALAPGGQAGTSSKIENYLGFPTGISGQALAGRAQVQAQKFGAHLAIARTATALDCATSPFRLSLDDGGAVRARAVVVATGARYRRLDLVDYDRFEGQGIQYAATAMEAQLCADQEVVIVGGGNSAGQAAMFLSRSAGHVHVVVRGEGLAATMSDYLVQRIATSGNVTLHARSEVTAVRGDRYLREVTWTNRVTGASETRAVGALFVMIGAVPNTDWLRGCVALDDQGFVRTGQGLEGRALTSPFATTWPGVFAVGDVRSGSVKRVASGVGEGSVVVHAIHEFLRATTSGGGA